MVTNDEEWIDVIELVQKNHKADTKTVITENPGKRGDAEFHCCNNILFKMFGFLSFFFFLFFQKMFKAFKKQENLTHIHEEDNRNCP